MPLVLEGMGHAVQGEDKAHQGAAQYEDEADQHARVAVSFNVWCFVLCCGTLLCNACSMFSLHWWLLLVRLLSDSILSPLASIFIFNT